LIFLDTCILIDYSKDKIKLDTYISETYLVNSIVQLEFLSGALNKQELKKLNRILTEFELLELNQDILNLSTQLINQYTLSHGMTVYDSIIAASCMIYDIPLWTYNKKDFRFLNIELK